METKKLVGILGILLGVALIIVGIVLAANKPLALRSLTADFEQQDDYYQYTYKSVSELVKGLDQQNRLLHAAICSALIACGAIIFGKNFANVVPKIAIEPVKRKPKGATKILKQKVIQK